MKHLRTLTIAERPANARSLLEWSQIGSILVTFSNAISILVGALGNIVEIKNSEG